MAAEPILSGDLAAFGVFEVIAFLATSRQTCVCEFHFDADVVKKVHFDRGDIVFAASSVADDRLGESLVRAGRITRAQLDIASRAVTPTNRLGKVLVEMGCLTPRGLYEAVRGQIEEIVESLFAFDRGRFAVTAGLPEGSTRVRLSAPTREFVLDAVGRADGGPPATARRAPAARTPADRADLAPIVARYDRALERIAGVMRAHGIDPAARLGEFVAGGETARVALFQGVPLGAPGGLDVRRLVANASGPSGAAALGETPADYLEKGLEELFAYSLFAVQDLVKPAEAEAIAAEMRAIFAGDGG
jgi:hypothetical protein